MWVRVPSTAIAPLNVMAWNALKQNGGSKMLFIVNYKNVKGRLASIYVNAQDWQGAKKTAEDTLNVEVVEVIDNKGKIHFEK